ILYLNGKKKKLTELQLGGILYGRSCSDSYTTIAKNGKCGKTTVHDVLKQYDKTGSAIAKKQSGCKPIFGALELDELKRMVI
ncbi:17903_t:CDS:1, partial [Cetraspora pellucida]